MTLLKKIKYNSPVTMTFTILALIATILGIATKGDITALLFETYRASFKDLLMYVRLFTHVLGHSGWNHYASNMLLFLVVGPIVEERYGSKNFLEMIALTALCTGIVNNIFFPHTALLGASGIVFMCIILSSAGSIKDGEIPITFLLVFVIYVGREIISAVTVKDQVSQLTHIIGGLLGALYGIFYAKETAAGRGPGSSKKNSAAK